MMKVFVHVRCKNLSNSRITENKENKRAILLNNHQTQARANFKKISQLLHRGKAKVLRSKVKNPQLVNF